MNIAFFVSNHGYGHLMRELPIFGELLDHGNRVVLVTAEKHIALSKAYLNNHTKRELITIADEVDVGFCCRPIDMEAVKEIRQKHDKVIVYALTAHTAIVFVRYMLLALEQRQNEDMRTYGELLNKSIRFLI